jgi:hypothetical protein
MKVILLSMTGVRLVVLAGACALAGGNGACAEEVSHIRNPSPDGHFALQTHEKRGPGTVTYEDSEVIALPSHDVLMKIEATDKPAADILWSPNAKRFAFYQDAGLRYGFVRVYELADGAFHEVTVPEVGPGEDALPKGAHHDTVDTTPERWLDADTLLVRYAWRAAVNKGDGEEELKANGRYQIHFTKDGHAVVTPKGKLKFTREK